MSIYNPFKYQEHAGEHIRKYPFCGLFLDMGLGKTIITLTELEWMLYQDLAINRVLIIGPKRVIQSVWKQEAEKWTHTQKLKISIVWGSQQERITALREKADIYLINRGNVPWLVGLFKTAWPFDMVVVDESSSFKSHASQRFKALKSVRPFIKRMVLLTGTPAPNGLLDLWSQIYLLDEGERLGKTIGGYRTRYFLIENVSNTQQRKYVARKESPDAIHTKIGDICISMKSEDYLELPELMINDIKIELPVDIKRRYDEFEEEQVMMIMDQEITALSAGALTNKLLQFANGAVYLSDKSGDYVNVHDEKMGALDEIIEEANGQNIIIFYSFRHDVEKIMNAYPHARMLKNDKDILDWNEGKISLLVAHPASAGHGLNLQFGGHTIVFYGLNWSLELYQQAIKRLHRIGQLHTVMIHRILCKGTMDTRVAHALLQKERGQDALMEAVKAVIAKYIS